MAVTVDFSNVDSVALKYAVTLCHPTSTVILIHVVETVSALVMGQETSDAETHSDKQRLDEYAAQIDATGRHTEVVIGYGNPRRTIPDLVNSSSPDLVVMAGHGHTGLETWSMEQRSTPCGTAF
ncbi:MAG: universal stress protein [Ignavibacteria bacterium]|nr:universal stress protein [Ignavibacteria bacterium]